MYADDLVIFSPSSLGLQRLLSICSKFGIDNDVKYNASKSHVMVIRCKEHSKLVFPDFYLCDKKLDICSETKYLGHFLTDDLSDDRDIYRQCRKLYAQGNTLVRKFHMCSRNVKVILFRAYCTPLYTAHLWYKYKKASLTRLTVAYNDVMRMLLRIPRNSSASRMFADVKTPACQAVIRNLVYKFMVRIDSSENHVIDVLVNPLRGSLRYASELRKQWLDCLMFRDREEDIALQ